MWAVQFITYFRKFSPRRFETITHDDAIRVILARIWRPSNYNRKTVFTEIWKCRGDDVWKTQDFKGEEGLPKEHHEKCESFWDQNPPVLTSSRPNPTEPNCQTWPQGILPNAELSTQDNATHWSTCICLLLSPHGVEKCLHKFIWKTKWR